ncbi:unnamed protein product [Allacma fusca]|uniref:BTB domain-containing protein n=1 Tax=Allacma fusca TaxID=39272 RepID=A0A8J2LRW2_9HEXA|nr:unnamed protein product [Allacma fusca]
MPAQECWLVDMRRSAIGAEHPPSPPTESPLSPAALSGFISPPILPAKPTSASPHGKPLPPRPNSTSSSMLSMSTQMKPFPQSPYANSKINPNSGPGPQSSFSVNFNQRSVPNLPQLLQPKRLFLSPQPQQSLSQTNLVSSNGNLNLATNGGLTKSSNNASNAVSYYADLIPNVSGSSVGPSVPIISPIPQHPGQHPQQQQQQQPPPKPRVRVEWKSVENLQQNSNNNPRISTNIDFGEPHHYSNNSVSQNGINNLMCNGQLSKLNGSKNSIIGTSSEKLLSFDSNNAGVVFSGSHGCNHSSGKNKSDLSLDSMTGLASGISMSNRTNNNNGNCSKAKSDDHFQPLNSSSSCEYDRIKSPVKDFSVQRSNSKDRDSGVGSTNGKENLCEQLGNKSNLLNGTSGCTGGFSVNVNDVNTHFSSGCHNGNGTPATLNPNLKNSSSTPIATSATTAVATKSGAESTDCSSLGRSSTSDGDFGTLGASTGTGSLNTVNAGSTPSERKSRHSAPSSKLKSRRRNILQHLSMEEMRLLNSHQRGNNNNNNNCNSNTNTGGSSSDGSSGHASMSDSQTSGSPPAEYARITSGGNLSHSYKSVLKSVPEDEVNLSNSTRLDSKSDGNRSSSSQNVTGSKKSSSRSRHRNKESILLGGGGGNSNSSGLEDIKQAIEQLTLRSYHGSGGRDGHHSSYSTSTYSSMSGSECDRHRRPHLIRHSSLETINTQVTSADEFVWVDSHNRLVELQHFPWSNHDILKVIERSTRLRDNLERISMETVPRISYLLQRALVRISRETQRLSRAFGFCSKQEVTSAFRIVLAPGLADSCIKACLRAAAMFSVSTNDPLHRESKSSRAGLHLHVGRFQRWMCEVRLGRFVHEFAAIHLTAGMENLIEEILGQALSFITTNISVENNNSHPVLTAAILEQAIANNGDLWGLLQPYAHLNAGRTASGALALPRWASIASVDSSGSSSTTIGANQDDSSLRHQHNKSLEQSLLTTCVGSVAELADILSRVSHYHHKQTPSSNGSGNSASKAMAPSWSPSAIHTLFYFMRCSQLETADEQVNLTSSTATLGSETIQRQHHQQNRMPVQELVYERPFIVLPPLIEWVRVSTAHADHRHSWLIDKDDVMQTARLLLPGIDCPVRLISSDEFSWPRRPIDEFECNRRLKIDLAFKMLTSGRSDLVAQALLLMPPSKANTFNETGLSPLILASVRGEETMVRVLLDAGADPDIETPPNGPNFPHSNSETQHWTALTFASLMGHINVVKILLERGANVEGGAKLSEEKSTQTPLQVSSATGNLDVVSTLLNYGANPFLSTLVRDSLCYTGSAQRGSFSALSVAASHGQRTALHKLLSHPFNTTPSSKEVLSLEEILAEGVQHPAVRNAYHQNASPNRPCAMEEPKILTKSQVKVLQEAMYQSAENGHLEITLDMRNLGVPWTLHCWVNALGTAHDLRCEPVVDQLLQDFLQILPNEDFSQGHFAEECLPLLFTIFRNSKNEGTTLLLADIFQTCYGRDSIKEIRDTTILNGTRIDPKYVNNPELSDVQFRVEGRVFYAHKIVLVTSSPRFKSMLKSAPESNPPILQINDIRYPIFQMVMEYLYNGGCDSIRKIDTEDILELMAAANFFQLDGLLRFCEAKCSLLVTIESVVSLYIHAKVYNAVQLLEYCQGFLLQNMVALLTYDDSVRRLIFGKKLHNHDVLAGLLLTLQARLKWLREVKVYFLPSIFEPPVAKND